MKNYNIYKTYKIIFLTLAVSYFLVGCSDKNLIPLKYFSLFKNTDAELKINFCSLDADAVKAKLKFIFIIDKSSSNCDGGHSLKDYPPTDQNGNRRYLPLEEFISNASTDETVYYSLINFSTSASVVRNFTNNKESFLQTILSEHHRNGGIPSGTPVDGGFTDFLAALDKAKNLIQQDINSTISLEQNQRIKTKSHYVIFFISDGAPRVRSGSQIIMQNPSTIRNIVDSIISLEQTYKLWVGSITLHTGYYFEENDPQAQNLMSDMAIINGHGEFYSFSAGQAIDFTKFAVPVRNIRRNLTDVFISNTNTVWEAAYLKLDSDGDTISDETEILLGSNPALYDSDLNGVSDGVEYRLNGKPCKDVQCDPKYAFKYEKCRNDFNPQIGTKGEVIYKDKDSDGLNECEESSELLGSSDEMFDTSEQWIPDFLAFKNNISLLRNVYDAHSDNDFDGITNYMEIKLNTPPRFDNRLISFLKSYKYEIKMESSDERRDCYSLEVSNISVIGEKNLLKIYILENTAVIDTEKFLRIFSTDIGPGETKSLDVTGR